MSQVKQLKDLRQVKQLRHLQTLQSQSDLTALKTEQKVAEKKFESSVQEEALSEANWAAYLTDNNPDPNLMQLLSKQLISTEECVGSTRRELHVAEKKVEEQVKKVQRLQVLEKHAVQQVQLAASQAKRLQFERRQVDLEDRLSRKWRREDD